MCHNFAPRSRVCAPKTERQECAADWFRVCVNRRGPTIRQRDNEEDERLDNTMKPTRPKGRRGDTVLDDRYDVVAPVPADWSPLYRALRNTAERRRARARDPTTNRTKFYRQDFFLFTFQEVGNY